MGKKYTSIKLKNNKYRIDIKQFIRSKQPINVLEKNSANSSKYLEATLIPVSVYEFHTSIIHCNYLIKLKELQSGNDHQLQLQGIFLTKKKEINFATKNDKEYHISLYFPVIFLDPPVETINNLTNVFNLPQE